MHQGYVVDEFALLGSGAFPPPSWDIADFFSLNSIFGMLLLHLFFLGATVYVLHQKLLISGHFDANIDHGNNEHSY